ncbi:hypothetical protein A2U01_0087704, partial [Trifolium medium]|nr:hypothetical protein [Trifolium medium]
MDSPKSNSDCRMSLTAGNPGPEFKVVSFTSPSIPS